MDPSLLSICLFVIVWVINTIHESLAVIDLVCQGRLYKSLYVRSVNKTILHGIQIVVLVNPVPVPTSLQPLLENQIEPYTGTAAIVLAVENGGEIQNVVKL